MSVMISGWGAGRQQGGGSRDELKENNDYGLFRRGGSASLRAEVAMMKRLIPASIWFFVGCVTPAEKPPVPTYSAATFFETTTLFGASFSADESRLLVSSDETGIFNVLAIPVDGSASEVLTQSPNNANFAVSFFPEDDRFLFTADQGGDELNHLYVHDADGAVVDLTPGEKLRAMFFGFSGDHRFFWVLSNERDQRHFDVYRYSVDGYERDLVFQNDTGWLPGKVTRNGRFLALVKSITNANTDIYLVDLEKESEPLLVTEHEGDAQHWPLQFTPDSRELYYRTDAHGEFQQAWSYDIETGTHRPVVEAEWDVMYVSLSETGKYRVTAINEDARTTLSLVDTESGREVALPELPEGDITGVSISRSETKIAFYVNSDTSPSNLHVLDLKSGEERRLTDTLNPKIAPEHLVDGEVIRYQSFDGLEIPAIQYRPHGASSTHPAPALVWVHGGPGGQSRKGYRATIQHLVDHGYAVLAVNNRGSSGYGKTFFHMDDQKHGEVDLQDCVWARRYLESLDWIDVDTIGIIGGSYGGYMVGPHSRSSPTFSMSGLTSSA